MRSSGHQVSIKTDNRNTIPLRNTPQPGKKTRDIQDLKMDLPDFETRIIVFPITNDTRMIAIP
jgi:hypothetical protein